MNLTAIPPFVATACRFYADRHITCTTATGLGLCGYTAPPRPLYTPSCCCTAYWTLRLVPPHVWCAPATTTCTPAAACAVPPYFVLFRRLFALPIPHIPHLPPPARAWFCCQFWFCYILHCSTYCSHTHYGSAHLLGSCCCSYHLPYTYLPPPYPGIFPCLPTEHSSPDYLPPTVPIPTCILFYHHNSYLHVYVVPTPPFSVFHTYYRDFFVLLDTVLPTYLPPPVLPDALPPTLHLPCLPFYHHHLPVPAFGSTTCSTTHHHHHACHTLNFHHLCAPTPTYPFMLPLSLSLPPAYRSHLPVHIPDGLPHLHTRSVRLVPPFTFYTLPPAYTQLLPGGLIPHTCHFCVVCLHFIFPCLPFTHYAICSRDTHLHTDTACCLPSCALCGHCNFTTHMPHTHFHIHHLLQSPARYFPHFPQPTPPHSACLPTTMPLFPTHLPPATTMH